jgi:hypothetical protein
MGDARKTTRREFARDAGVATVAAAELLAAPVARRHATTPDRVVKVTGARQEPQ